MNTTIELGTLSSGTMRREDLIPVFINEILRIDPNNEVATRIWCTYCDYEEETLDEYWESQSSNWDLDELFDELNDLCDLPYVSFGSHPDDGADYGYWVDWESLYLDIVRGQVVAVKNIQEISDENQLYLHDGLTLYKGNDIIWTSY